MGSEVPDREVAPAVVEGQVVDLDTLLPQPLRYPPVLWQKPKCRCGAGTPEAHGRYVDAGGCEWSTPSVVRYLTCDEVLAMRARSAFRALPAWRRALARVTFSTPEGW